MNGVSLVNYLIEFGFIIGTFVVGLSWAVWFGRQSLINLICAGYIALLSFTLFPHFTSLADNTAWSLGVYLTFLVAFFFFFRRVMPPPYRENRFESFGKKILLSGAFTLLALLLSSAFLPVSDYIQLESNVFSFLTHPIYSFWYLWLPIGLVALN